MGLQITVMLTVVTYLDVIQDSVPVFNSQAPLMLQYFCVNIIFLTGDMLLTTYTLFLNHVRPFECKNFSPSYARSSIALAAVFNCMSCTLWDSVLQTRLGAKLD